MTNRPKPADDIKNAEKHEALKRALMRILDDTQVQETMLKFLRAQFGFR
jgi:hypothetical protein